MQTRFPNSHHHAIVSSKCIIETINAIKSNATIISLVFGTLLRPCSSCLSWPIDQLCSQSGPAWRTTLPAVLAMGTRYDPPRFGIQELPWVQYSIFVPNLRRLSRQRRPPPHRINNANIFPAVDWGRGDIALKRMAPQGICGVQQPGESRDMPQAVQNQHFVAWAAPSAHVSPLQSILW